jgi:glycosyltransferase involved in cell wall biosynthesis
MKVALVGPTYPYRGGIAHHTTLLYRYLKKRHEVRFWSFLRQYPGWLYPGKTDKDFSQRSLIENGVIYSIDSVLPHTWFKTAHDIVQFRPDVLVIPWWVVFWGPIFSVIASIVKKRTGSRVVYICHNVLEHESSRWKVMVSRYAYNLADGFLVHSEQEAIRLREIRPDARIKKVFHPVYSLLEKRGIAQKDARHRLKIDGWILLFFGFVREYKGLEYLIKALPLVLKQIDVTLMVVGEFWQDRRKYFDLIDELNLQRHVRIIDQYVPNHEIEMYFSAANVLVMPYVSVTGSGVVQLAFYYGLPVIVTNVGMLTEIVEDGRTGFIVPPRDVDALADAIVQYFRENREEEFRKNIELTRGRFGWEHIISSIEKIAC